MAVYKQKYRPYAGRWTAPRWRFWVLGRYGFQQVFAWRTALVLFVLSFVPVLGAGSLIYFHHNLDALLAFQISAADLIPIDGQFFAVVMGIQSTLAFFMAALVGPGLVSPDLTNGALPLYLSRPVTRSEYVLGKLSVLGLLLSLTTWIPGLLLFLMQSSLAGAGWFSANLRIGVAVVVGACAWILTVSLLALALSAWVRWRPVAGALLFGIFFVAAGFGQVFNDVMGTSWGAMMILPRVMEGIWRWLFVDYARFGPNYPLPIWSAWLSLGIVCAVSVWLLSRKVRAYEVVR